MNRSTLGAPMAKTAKQYLVWNPEFQRWVETTAENYQAGMLADVERTARTKKRSRFLYAVVESPPNLQPVPAKLKPAWIVWDNTWIYLIQNETKPELPDSSKPIQDLGLGGRIWITYRKHARLVRVIESAERRRWKIQNLEEARIEFG